MNCPRFDRLTLGTTDVMLVVGEVILGGNNPFKSDLDWDLL